MEELKALFVNGVLGFYDQVEVTEIFAILPDKSITNIYTIIVAENRNNEPMVEPTFINQKRITLKKLKEWKFGIKQYTVVIKDILGFLYQLDSDNTWSASGEVLNVDDTLIFQPPKYVASDSFDEVPINKVLKNNFWDGSYIVEWENTTKSRLKKLLDNPFFLQELSEKIQQYVPISLASVSDRLGNFIVQIPNEILKARCGKVNREDDDLQLTIEFHPDAEPRDLILNCEMEYDQSIYGYRSTIIRASHSEIINIPIQYDQGTHKRVIWDLKNEIILSATRPSLFIKTIYLGGGIIENEPRIFAFSGEDIRIKVQHMQAPSAIGEDPLKSVNWTEKRIYKDEKQKLLKQKIFVQYKPISGQVNKEHSKAIKDIRSLITKYGENGVWLWDPYLSADDLLKTLFYCPYFNADLRALTNLEVYKPNNHCGCKDKPDSKKGKNAQFEEQRKIFNALDSNWFGIKLEFRARIGNSGWNFHDRFLIFPETIQRGVLAWSLGTSVNSVGKQHHILQQVDDGQLIADAFMELWNQLDKEEHIIVKKP